MFVISWLIACSSSPVVSVSPAVHAERLQTHGLPLLVLTPGTATLNGEPITQDTLPERLTDDVHTVLIAVDPAVPWGTTVQWLRAMADPVDTAAFIVADDSGQTAVPNPAGTAIDVAWLDERYAIRTSTNEPLITGPEPRLLGAIQGAGSVRVLAGPQRATGAAVAVLDAARSAGVSCLRAELESADFTPSTAIAGESVTVGESVRVLPIALGDSASCPAGLGRLEATTIAVEGEGRFGFEAGALTEDELITAFSAVDGAIDQCVGRSRATPPDAGTRAHALAQIDVADDGSVFSVKVLVGEQDGRVRDVQERCIARVLYTLNLPTEGQRARFVLTVIE